MVGNPHGLPALYAAVATDPAAEHVAVVRPPLRSPTTGDQLVNLLRTDTDLKWINSQYARDCMHRLQCRWHRRNRG